MLLLEWVCWSLGEAILKWSTGTESRVALLHVPDTDTRGHLGMGQKQPRESKAKRNESSQSCLWGVWGRESVTATHCVQPGHRRVQNQKRTQHLHTDLHTRVVRWRVYSNVTLFTPMVIARAAP